ncbi:MAG: outer membrane lipoprotein-sorting protein [candidate division Zixibacteria bacterium]|nr:outer membrane lipoprotein-sorting protein [candidate division Zixibacteria bacterium]
MKTHAATALMFLLALAFGTSAVQADEAALKLMQESHKAYYYASEGGSARVTMEIVDKKGRARERVFWMIRTDVEDMGDQRYYTHFIKPADVRRTALVVHKKAEGNDDRWLYVPALDLVRRIAANDSRSSFVGSDFTYEDVSGRLPSMDDHKIIGPDSAMGKAATKVRSTPKDDGTAEYEYRYTWVDDETKLPIKEEYVDKKGETIRRFEIEQIVVIEGFPTATVRTMHVIDDGQTTIRFDEVTYEAPLDAGRYNERLLKNPPPEFTK